MRKRPAVGRQLLAGKSCSIEGAAFSLYTTKAKKVMSERKLVLHRISLANYIEKGQMYDCMKGSSRETDKLALVPWKGQHVSDL